MLPIYQLKLKQVMKACGLLLVFAVCGYVAPAYSAPVTIPTAAEMLQNISDQLPLIMRLTTAIAYVMGLYFVFYGLLKLKQFGEARTQMSQEHHLKEPLIMLVVGALLLYLPSSVEVGLSTFWSTPSPYGFCFRPCFYIHKREIQADSIHLSRDAFCCH